MKNSPDMLDLEASIQSRAVEALRSVLEQVPVIALKRIEHEVGVDRRVDILVRLKVGGRPHELICEVLSSGQPRFVRTASLQLRHEVLGNSHSVTPVLIAPYLSPQSQSLCRDHEIGYLDLEGNCFLSFDGVFIERRIATRPSAEHRTVKSIFKPKAAQVLRVLLREPRHPWRVANLAEAAGVSLGHVSNVRAALLDREWAKAGGGGLYLTDPDALLDAWRDTYSPPEGKRLAWYTTLHGSTFEEAARKALGAANRDGAATFASFSAAQWLAPYARTGTHFFYADETGLKVLQRALKLTSTSRGENVVITLLRDCGPLLDRIEPAPGVVCTSPVQTYLDLFPAGERGREAAEHLRREKLTWTR